MLSNHDVPQIYDLYSGYNIETFDVRRMINCDASKRTGSEVIIRNYASPSALTNPILAWFDAGSGAFILPPHFHHPVPLQALVNNQQL